MITIHAGSYGLRPAKITLPGPAARIGVYIGVGDVDAAVEVVAVAERRLHPEAGAPELLGDRARSSATSSVPLYSDGMPPSSNCFADELVDELLELLLGLAGVARAAAPARPCRAAICSYAACCSSRSFWVCRSSRRSSFCAALQLGQLPVEDLPRLRGELLQLRGLRRARRSTFCLEDVEHLLVLDDLVGEDLVLLGEVELVADLGQDVGEVVAREERRRASASGRCRRPRRMRSARSAFASARSAAFRVASASSRTSSASRTAPVATSSSTAFCDRAMSTVMTTIWVFDREEVGVELGERRLRARDLRGQHGLVRRQVPDRLLLRCR